MQYSREVEEMYCVAKGAKHDPAPIPEEGKWVKAYQIGDISGLSHGIGRCAPRPKTRPGALALMLIMALWPPGAMATWFWPMMT